MQQPLFARTFEAQNMADDRRGGVRAAVRQATEIGGSMNLQDLVDGMSSRMQRERAESQMTLGKMIETLEAMPPVAFISGICDPHSYRGYYSDLAFEKSPQRIMVKEALAMCRAAMGEVFIGYKGGEFVMGKLTPVWLANYGECGAKIMDIHADGTIETAEDD